MPIRCTRNYRTPLLTSAGRVMDFLDTMLTEIEKTKTKLGALQNKLIEFRDDIETKDAKIRDLKSENKALKVAYQTLADKRREDIATLHAWQQQMAEPATDAISSSQPPPSLSSDPPSYQASQPLLPQRTLKRSRPDQLALSELVHTQWHPSDFMMVPDAPENIVYRNPSTDASKNLHTSNCEACKIFISILISPVEDIHRPETLPGFWRSEFASTQERADEEKAQQNFLLKECLFRLLEALNMGRFRFSDPNLQRAVTEGAIVWDD